MSRDDSHPNAPNSWLTLLERSAATVLLVVLLALGWMVIVVYEPGWARLPSVELEVLVIIVLLVVALLLVSILALLQTR